jgi:hypothetical protein
MIMWGRFASRILKLQGQMAACWGHLGHGFGHGALGTNTVAVLVMILHCRIAATAPVKQQMTRLYSSNPAFTPRAPSMDNSKMYDSG